MGSIILALSSEKSEVRESKHLAQGYLVVSGRAQNISQAKGIQSTLSYALCCCLAL